VWIGRLEKALILSFAPELLARAAAYYAPRFLVCADKPVQSDFVVLFVGLTASPNDKKLIVSSE
jgi:hypothetical protein